MAPGTDKWITNAQSRRFGHLLRAQNDAILVGIETVLADDPELTCRIAGLEDRSPLRVVLDTHLRLPPRAQVVRGAKTVPTVIFTVATQGGDELRAAGVEIVTVARDAQGRPDLSAMLEELARRNVTRLLVEGGATVHAAFLAQGLADALEIFTAPITLGDRGLGEIAVLNEAIAARFTQTSVRKFGGDVLESYRLRA